MKHAEDVSRETAERLEMLGEQVVAWNRSINLVSPRDLPLLKQRHIGDSLQLAVLIPPTVAHAIDLGSGAGFPGLVLAIATGIHFTLVEADARKCAFLREAARRTEAPVTICAQRIETVTANPFPLITARALAPLPKLLTLCAPFIDENTTLILPKGERAEAELAEAAQTWTMKVERHISRTGVGGVILRLSGVSRVG